MTWAGDRLAVVSLGMSCQTALQIRLREDVFTERGYHGRATNSYFDWIVCSTDAVVATLNDGIPPLRREDVWIPDGRPIDKRYNAIFWHEFLPDRDAPDVYDIEGMFGSVCEKRGFLADRMAELVKVERLLFVWSNTQSDLAGTSPRYAVERQLTEDRASRLMMAAERYAGRPATFLFVVHPDEWRPFDTPERATIAEIRQQEGGWQGDGIQWREALVRAMDMTLS